MVRKHSHSKKHSAPKHHHARHHSAAPMSAMSSPVFVPDSMPMRSSGEGRIFWALFTMVAIALIVVIILRLLAGDSTTTATPSAPLIGTTKAIDAASNNKGLFFGLSGGALVLIALVSLAIWKYGASSGLKDRAVGGLDFVSTKTHGVRRGARRIGASVGGKVKKAGSVAIEGGKTLGAGVQRLGHALTRNKFRDNGKIRDEDDKGGKGGKDSGEGRHGQ